MKILSFKKSKAFNTKVIAFCVVPLFCVINAPAESLRLLTESFLDIGNHWEYQVHVTLIDNDTVNLTISQVEDITEAKNVAGFDTKVRRRQITGPGIAFTEYNYFFINGMGQLSSADFEEDDSTETVRDGDPTELLPLVIDTSDSNRRVGHGLYHGADKFSPDRWNGFENTFVTYIEEESITVPAGTFDCVVIDFRLEWDDQDGDTGRDETRFWINPNIGIIKAITNEFDISEGTTEQTTFTSELSSTSRTIPESTITANFEANVTSGSAPLTVQFMDLSTAENTTITTWQWDFDSDETIDSTSQNPQWIYEAPGVYSVQLAVSDSGIEDQITREGFINVISSTVVVPDVVELTEANANQQIMNVGLNTGMISTANSKDIPSGTVISQNPIAGSEVEEGSAVNLIISLGPTTVTVPDIRSSTQSDAETAIAASGLIVGTITRENHDAIPTGNVIRQTPEAGVEVIEGNAVNFVVSLGPSLVLVPDVISLTKSEAIAQIQAASLTVGIITGEHHETIAIDRVISQDPRGENEVGKATIVNLVISLGPATVVVPDLVGKSAVEAQAELLRVSLRLGTVVSEPSKTVPPGDIIRHDPEGGIEVNSRTLVNLFVSSSEVIVLKDGWNLCSTGSSIAGTSFEELLNNCAVTTVWQFENGRFEFAHQLSPLKGYWIHTFKATTLVIPLP